MEPRSPEARILRGPVDAGDRGAARRALIDRRRALPDADRRDADAIIGARMVDAVTRRWPAGGAVVAIFRSIRGEPVLEDAWQALAARGFALCLPVVVARDAPLAFLGWRPGDVLVAGAFGVPQPASGLALLPELLVIPCVGFDLQRYRLGYGGGFYDRTLAALRCPSVGVCHDDCEMTGFVPQPHDRPLDSVITERRSLFG